MQKPKAESLILRAAEAVDAELLFNWVNQPDSLANKLQTQSEVSWNDHLEWFNTRHADINCSLWIYELESQAVGQVRLEMAAEGLLVDIYVDALFRQSGFALRMLSMASREAWQRWPSVQLVANVKNDNTASCRLFEAAGYALSDQYEDHRTFRLMPPHKSITGETHFSFDRSEALYHRALATVPLASQTFSKSAMNLVKGASPLFFERGEGPYAWDIDGNRYLDYLLGLLPIVLGYCDPDVDKAIKEQLGRGIIFSLATPLEVELSELLVELIPCAEMVRFGKNGSDATSAAVRLARAYTGRDKIALCGYHGWHDWYIGTTSRSLGVPRAVQELSAAFPYNNANALEALLKQHPDEFAAIILEPAGALEPAPGFLERLRALSDEYGVVLIFDEIVTGFRIDIGGAQTYYGVTPDLACFGKSMGNGMPISAIVGRREIMRGMEDIFFSGTFGGEALSLAASIATIRKLQTTNTIPRLHRLGDRLSAGIVNILDECGLSTRFALKGVSWRPIVQPLESEVSGVIANSLLRQELVANGIFQGAGINLCLAHDTDEVFNETLAAWRQAAKAVSEAFASNNPESHLRGEPIQPVFQVRA